jgi:hypothetical protein
LSVDKATESRAATGNEAIRLLRLKKAILSY